MYALNASDLAWLVLVPCTLVLIAAIVLLGPPLGHALLAPTGSSHFWRSYVVDRVVRPEPTEHARYLLALLGPVLVGAATLVLARRRPASSPAIVSTLVMVNRAVLVVFVVAAVLYQHRFTYDASYVGESFRTVYFTAATLVVAIALAAVGIVGLQWRALTERLARVTRETRAKHAAAFVVAVAFVAIWLLSAYNDDASVVSVNGAVHANIPFWVDEAFAILNGQAPLVDFHAQYGQLWAYIAAGTLTVFGTSFAVYAITMLVGAAIALLAVFATLRRLTASSMVAIVLFLPFVATGFFMEAGTLENRYGPATLFSFFPIRYAGPYVLLWLVVRRLERKPARPPVLLFAVAGLVAINNTEFGVAAFGASLVALIAAEPERSLARLARLLGSALTGLACAAAIVAVLTFAVAGALPDFGTLATFPRIYGREGFGQLPIPPFGLHLVVYVTFAAALVTAAVRVVAGDDDPRLTGALAWAGVFGLGAGAYFVGRSHPHVLIDLFSAWSFALSLLLIVTVRGMLGRSTGRPRAVELLVLAGFAVTLCSLVQTPTPWSQVKRIREAPSFPPGTLTLAGVMRVAVAQLTVRGEPVALLMTEGHRIAEDLGVVDVTPYTNLELMLTVEQWRETVQALRRAGGTRLIISTERLLNEEVVWLRRAGYVQGRETLDGQVIEFVKRS